MGTFKSPKKQEDNLDDDEDLPVRERLQNYDSEEDPDYAPSESGSDDSLEYNSEAEDKDDEADVTYEDEHAKVINSEEDNEEEPVVVDTAASDYEHLDDEEDEDEDPVEPERVGVADVSECNTPQCEKPSHEDLAM